jgi:hypothetical protein
MPAAPSIGSWWPGGKMGQHMPPRPLWQQGRFARVDISQTIRVGEQARSSVGQLLQRLLYGVHIAPFWQR